MSTGSADGSSERPAPAALLRHVAGSALRHWAPYLGVSAAVFASSFAIGAVVGSERRSPLLPAPAGQNPYAGLEATDLLLHNGRVAAWLALGVLLFGLPTLYVLLLNGFLLGAGAVEFAGTYGTAATVAMLLPHGVLELPAIVLAGAISARWCHVGWQTARGGRREVPVHVTLLETVAAVLALVAMLGAAAVIEASVTGTVAESVT